MHDGVAKIESFMVAEAGAQIPPESERPVGQAGVSANACVLGSNV